MLKVLGPAGVGGDGEGLLWKLRIDPSRLNVEVGLLAARQDDLSALLGQRLRNRTADAPAGARDDSDATINAKSVGLRAAGGFGHG